ncbi:hypothetical protein N798_02400 [Knoellia flava TL1]|uniref:YcxB-like protein domain-containing protein n=2 Tax=Knoellia flava TaxID=913969 RepID=A0ABR4XIB9_9MICO|nr:hypothetical protein N798_02400 [Knoellia flava TL1]
MRRWVATRRSANEAARAFTRLTLGRRRWWAFVLVLELGFALAIGLGFDDRYGLATRLVFAPLYAVVPTVVCALLTLVVGHLLTLRTFRRRLGEGVTLEGGVGERTVVLNGPWTQTTLSFDGIASMRRVADWVFLQQVGSPVMFAWPAHLFEPTGLARLEENLRDRSRMSASSR